MTAALDEMTAEFDTEEVDPLGPTPDAPFGLKLDGTPKKAPGGRPSGKAGRKPGPRIGRSRPAPSVKPPAARRAAPKSTTGTDYRQGLKGIIHIFSMPLLYSPKTRMDGAALLVHGDGFAEAINETAKERPEVRDLCERLMKVGPYGLVFEALLTIGMQMATNHNLLPIEITSRFGAVPPDVLAEQLGMRVAAAEAEYAAAQKPFDD